MKADFTLSRRFTKNENNLTRKFSFTITQTREFKIFGVIYAVSLAIFYILQVLDIEVAQWINTSLLIAAIIAIFAFLLTLVVQGNGRITLTENEIQLYPNNQNEKLADSIISLDEIKELQISVIQSIRWWSSFLILHFEVHQDDQETSFGLIINNKKQEKQYLELLDSWYRSGYPIEEYDELGSRVFKLDQGKSYADIQKIKSEYGISWQ